MWKRYRIGFSVWGLGVYVLQLLPNLVWIMRPPKNDILSLNTSPYPVLEILEKVSGALIAAALILIIPRAPTRNHPLFLFLAIGFLCSYYAAWTCYFCGVVSPWLMVFGLAAMPPFCFASCAVWLRSYPVLFPCTLFAAVHIAITCQTYL